MLRKLSLILAVVLVSTGMLYAQSPASKNQATKQLYAIFDETWEAGLKDNPTFASFLGDKRYNDRWGDQSLAAFDRRQQYRVGMLARLKKVNRTQLSPTDQLNYDLFKKDLEEAIEGNRFHAYLMPLSQAGGIQTQDELSEFISFDKVKDYEDWIARLNAFPGYMDQVMALMRRGQEEKVLRPSVVMGRVPAQIDKQIVSDPEKVRFTRRSKVFRRIFRPRINSGCVMLVTPRSPKISSRPIASLRITLSANICPRPYPRREFGNCQTVRNITPFLRVRTRPRS